MSKSLNGNTTDDLQYQRGKYAIRHTAPRLSSFVSVGAILKEKYGYDGKKSLWTNPKTRDRKVV